MYRIGIGYDLHRLSQRRKLILGGINIPYSQGLLGHSDADVLIHALGDALLGAAGLKDIGEHFPASNPAYKDISSIKLLQKIARLLKGLKYSINNIDAVVLAEHPNLSAFKTKMRHKIAKTLDISTGQVNIKAKTAEGTGPVGKGEAISAYAIALIKRR